MKTIVAVCTLIFAVCAGAEEKSVVTFSGKGNNPIEVRDASGKVEVVHPSTLRLNQIPADAAARERVYREQVETEASALTERRIAEGVEEEAEKKEAEELEAVAEAEAIAAAAEAELEHEEHYPMKVRRKTVRGTRYIENPPPPRETPPAATGPIITLTGKGKAESPPATTPDTPAADSTPAPESSPEGF